MRTRRGELAKNKQCRAIGSKRVEEALCAVGARFTQLGEKDPRLTEAQKYVPRLKGIFKFFLNEDPAQDESHPVASPSSWPSSKFSKTTQIESSQMPSLTSPAWHASSSVNQENMLSPLPMIKEEAHLSGCKTFSSEHRDKTISTQPSVLCMPCNRAPSLLSSLPTKSTVYEAKLLDTVPMTNPSGMSPNEWPDESSTCDSAMHPLTHHYTPTTV